MFAGKEPGQDGRANKVADAAYLANAILTSHGVTDMKQVQVLTTSTQTIWTAL